MRLRTFLLCAVVAAFAASSEANITTTSLRIQGAGLKVITTTVVTSVDLPTTVQTEFGGKQNDEAVALEGVVAVGELTGPGIETPIQLTTAPGHRFQIPGLSQQGIYYLQNVRLLKGTEFLQYASPATAIITVTDLLQTKVTVKQLSADDLRKRGITVDLRNYDVYEYSFTFIIDGKTVTIPYPVIIDPRTHEVQAVIKEQPYALPPVGLTEPPRWSPPQMIATDFGEEGQLPEPGKDPIERAVQGTRPSIPAAIIIPNSLAVLHQFFAVAIMVTNGAPEGSGAELQDLRATIHIPTALRTVKTTPQVSFGQPVPIVEPTTGQTFLVAQARGEAEWTLEGLEPGTHRLDFDLRAVLRQPGQVDVPMRATPSAAIVVHDPRFNINFSHPDTVRKGIEYSTYSFITNMSATEQTIVVTSGVQSCDENPGANVCRLNGSQSDSLTIPAGDMRLIEYRLRAGATGHVFATAGTIGDTDHLSASVRLHMGVSETGIPLSPATLLLPHYAQYVNPDIVSANLMLFGLGYSLATAPLNQMTAKFPRVIRTDIFQRAVDVARAGQRIFITDSDPAQKRDSIAHLALDLLGNGGYELREWDQLRRQESSGRAAGASIARELEATGLANGATMTSFIDAFANATAHRPGFVAALAHGSATGTRPYAITLAGHTSARRTDIPNEAASGWLRNLPYSDLSRFNGAGESGELALVARWTEDVDVLVTPASDGPFQLELLYPDTSDGALKRAHFNFNGSANQTITINVTRGATSLNAMFGTSGIAAIGSISSVAAAMPAIVGARQDLHLDPDGHKVSVLFNRPVKVQEGVDLRTKFTGAINFNRDSVVYDGPRPISGAALQDDGRTVNATFAHTLSQNATYTIAVGDLLDPLNDQTVPFNGTVAPKIDNDAPAGVVYGKVIKGDNTPIAGADVRLAQYLPDDPSAEPQGTPQYDVSQSNGAFLFEFVRRQIDAGWSGAYRLEGFSTVNGKASVEGSVRLPGKVHFVNLQYLGRGAAQGTVRYNDGSIAAGAIVTVGSTMFSQFRTATTDVHGEYRIEDLPVGPLTFSAKDEPGNVTFAANEIATPGQLVTQDLSIFRQPFPGVGTVYGIVRRSDTNEPMAGIHVGVYSQGYGLTDGFTDASGRFTFEKIPAGFVSVLAEDWAIARQSVAADVDLKANETKEANLLFLIAPDQKYATLTGEVWREDPLRPGVTERVAGALVKIAGYRVVTADADGKFTYENLPLLFSGRAIQAYDPVTQRINSATVPTLTESGPNNVAIFINAFSRGTGTVRVRLLNAAGQPVPGYRVIVPGFPAKLLQPAPGQIGVYELKDVAVGQQYQIVAVPSGVRPPDGVADTRAYGDQMVRGSARVEFNGHIAALTLRLPGEGTVRVKVRSQFDLITDVRLTYMVWYEGEQNVVEQALVQSTAKNGEADRAVFTKIPALTGYVVQSSHPQYGYGAAGGELAFDGDLNDELLQLNKLATVSGTVYAIDGITPVAGATVSINNGRFEPGSQITGPDGRFRFDDQPSSVNITVTAQVTQSDVYRIGFSSARTPDNGGAVENMAIVLRKRGFVDGQVVYANYKRYDPDNVANNIADDTPGDYSDNAPVPLAKFYLRELDFPGRAFGYSAEPLVADVAGRFVINNVFIGALRASAWDPGNEELRGDWVGRIDEEGAEAAPKAYIAITGGGGGVGAARITVVDPNQNYVEIQNAEVSVYSGGRAFDFASTDATGSVEFTELPTGTYSVSAYSKSLGKTSRTESLTVPKDSVGTARLELEFSGEVDGTLTDPENANAPVPGSHVRLTASNYQTQSSTDVAGFFVFNGVREGAFALDAKDTLTNRRAHADRTLSVLDPHRTVNLELEPTETLHFAAYLPDDFGNKSDVLAAPVRMEVVQRCYRDTAGARHCDYERQLQGNPLQFPGVLENSGYSIGIWQPGDDHPTINLDGSFPTGTAANPFIYVHPAYGELRVLVTQVGAPVNGAKVNVTGAGANVVVYTDTAGQAVVRNIRLGQPVFIQASTIDNKFTGATSATIVRQSVPVNAEIQLGKYAGVTGYVEAEAGGPSIGTRVVANYGDNTAEVRTDSNGRYTFLGIPTPPSGATIVNLVFIGPDDTTGGGSTSRAVQADDGVVEAPSVKLDATSPQLEAILPADGSLNVSPDASISITFSEPLNTGTIHGGTFQLLDSDTGPIACSLTSRTLDNGKFVVTMTPPAAASGFPLRSNTLYRVIVSASVTDRTGHPLPASRGFTFTTSDYAEPRVQKVLPASPIPASTAFEFRFNEPIDPAPWSTNGSGVFHIYKLAAPGGASAAIASTLVANAFLDPTNMTLFFSPADVNPIEPESFYRVVFSGVRDPQGNTLAEQTYHFYSFDQVAPHVVFTAPAASEQLVSGSEYELRIELRNGSATGSLATDISKVEYFTVVGTEERPFANLTQAPFFTRVLGPEAPASGASFTVGAQAYDASGNRGPKTLSTWTVKPNAAPTNLTITPSVQSAYPSSGFTSLITFQDEGSFVSVTMTLSAPRNNGATFTTSVTQSYTRLANGNWPEVRFAHVLPNDAKAGEHATLSVTVSDVRGLVSAPVTASVDIAADTIQPNILSVTPVADTVFFDKQQFVIEAIVSDLETTVQSVAFLVDGDSYATASQSTGPTAGTQKFRSVPIEARAKAEDAAIPLVVTAKDFNGNTRSTTHDVLYRGVNDPDAPKVTWLCPVDRGALPALANNFALKLRLNVVDEDVRSVKFRIGTDVINATLLGGTEYGATHTFVQTPPAGPLTITAIVEDTVAAHTVELPIVLDLVSVDVTYTDPKAITAAEAPSFIGKSIALIGSGAVLAPQVPLALANLLVLNGARIETLPATTTREFKVDVTTTGVLYVDCDSIIDVTAKGYAGGWQDTVDGRNNDARGRTLGNTTTNGATLAASASHGGLGGLWLGGGVSNPAYGSIAQPTELGSGGGGINACCGFPGGAGGGAIALRGGSAEADISRIVIAGTLAADAASGIHIGGAGSGGSIWLNAKQVLLGTKTTIRADGGDDDFEPLPAAVGGGGGRISIAATTKLDLSTATVEASGGRNSNGDTRATGDGGAGTILFRRPGQEHGELFVDALFASSPHTTRPTPFSGALAFDKITAGPRALLVFNDAVSVGGVTDDKSTMTIDPTAAVILRDEAAALTMTTTPAEGADVIRDTPLSLTYNAAVAGGVASVTFRWSPEATPRVETFDDFPTPTPNHTLTLTVPPTTPLGTATLLTEIRDRAGRTYTMPTRTFRIIENSAPLITGFTITPGNSIYAGRDVVATVTATDDVAVKTIAFDAKLNGASLKTQTFTNVATAVFTVPIASEVAGGSSLAIDVTISDAFAGRAPTTATQTVSILTDSGKPQVSVSSPLDGASYNESSLIPVRITASDAEVAVKEASVQLDGGSAIPLQLVAGEWRADLTAPPVDGTEPVQRSITITAKDYAGNTTITEPIALTIVPVIDANAPLLSWTCATNGAMFPVGSDVKLRVAALAANAQNPVQSVAMFVDGATTPLVASSIGNNIYEATLPIPANDADGRVYSVRAIATSAGGATSDVLTTFSVVVANVTIASTLTIDATNTAYDNKTVVVQSGTITIRGAHTFDRLLILGGNVIHAANETLNLTTTRGLYVGCDGAIDVSGRGYPVVTTYPGATPSSDGAGGSHIGRGGLWNNPGSSFGSIYRPQENGGGGGHTPGGGVVRINAGSLVVDGAVRANGDPSGGTGAGGSIWITTGHIAGAGAIEANSGVNTHPSNFSSGGGGAVAIEYSDASSVLPALNAWSSVAPATRIGGAGSVYVKSPNATYGDVTFDNDGRIGYITELPSLGSGIALAGTTAATLVTNRSVDIPSYFAGHWVDISTASGTRKGTWRIATISGKTVTLAPNGTETLALAVGDQWQGVYLFDAVHVQRGTKLTSADPIRGTSGDIVGSDVEIRIPLAVDTFTTRGSGNATSITAKNVVVETGSILGQYGSSITLDVQQTLTVRGALDVSGQGYMPLNTYPGASVSSDGAGGSHIGRGGLWNNPGSTFGSITRPQENGGGGGHTPGGGVIRVNASSVVVDGAIRANGVPSGGTGAGGSIWIITNRISGTGSIEASSGANTHPTNFSSGGGGAVSIEYTDATSVLPALQAWSSIAPSTRIGSAGSIYVKGPSSTYGDVTFDNGGRIGSIATEPPSLGTGSALTGTSGSSVITDRANDIPPFFIGHRVDIFATSGTRKGTWRIASISGKNFTLAPNAGETIDVVSGDTWRGVYLFDTIKLRSANVQLVDDMRGARNLDGNSSLTINDAPILDATRIAVTSRADGDFVLGTAGAVSDPQPPIVLIATNKRTNATFSANAAADGSFAVAVTGDVGDTFTLRARDSFALAATSFPIDVARSIGNLNGIAQVTLQRATATGGMSVTGAVRLLNPVSRASEGVITLGSSNAAIASMPATITIPIGASSGAFVISTTSVANATNVTITATTNGTSGNATLSVVPSGVLQSIALDPATIEGGATVNGTVTLSAATASAATVSLFTSNNSLATLPASIVIPAGASEGTFSVATSKVGAATNATITAVYGGTKTATLSLTACSALGAVAQPTLAPLTNSWIDDALPVNATATGDGTFTTAQSASGTQSIALSHQWSVSGLLFSVAPADNLVLYALIDPCNPPREILVTWNDGTNNYSASWGEDRIDATLAHARIASMPAAGVWVRLEVLAARFFSSTRTIQSLTVRTDGGAVWLDRIGTATCSLAPHVSAPTSFAAADAVWVDDATPIGVTTRNDTNNSAAWVWDATQSASGTASHLEPLAGNVHQHYYYGDPNPIAIEPGDVLYTYVLIDPCNPPREIMLQWNDGTIWHRATWGEDLIGGERYRVGALPKSGEWIRLEVPAAAVGLNERKVYGAAFTLYDGRAWFDRSGKFGRVNLALHQPARQSSDFDPIDAASLAVDGNVASARGSMSITAFGADQWWEVDLGETTPMIDSIEIRGRTDCCTNQTAEVTVFVSDSRIAEEMTLEQARALGASVGIYRSPGEVGATYTITVGRTGRYVRLWRTGTMHLTLPEVMVWAPANAARVNLAAGRPVYAPPSQMFLAYYPEHAANGSATDAWNTTGGIYHSNSAGDAYWQVDLGKSQPISSIDIGARTDCCPEQTSGYYILASDQPFTSDLLAPYLADGGVSAWWVGSQLPVIDVPIDKSARYIRIQRVGSDALVLTECRVWSQQPNTTQLLTHPRGSK